MKKVSTCGAAVARKLAVPLRVDREAELQHVTVGTRKAAPASCPLIPWGPCHVQCTQMCELEESQFFPSWDADFLCQFDAFPVLPPPRESRCRRRAESLLSLHDTA